MTDSVVTFSIKNNDPALKMTVTLISLIHKTASDTSYTTLVSGAGETYMSVTPRENLGKYVIDLATHQTKLTKQDDVVQIEAGSIGSYKFNFTIDRSKFDLANPNSSYFPYQLTSMLKTDWLKSMLVVKYVGRGGIFLLKADMKAGVESKMSVSFDDN